MFKLWVTSSPHLGSHLSSVKRAIVSMSLGNGEMSFESLHNQELRVGEMDHGHLLKLVICVEM
jgi:hypothetical protein